MGIHIMPALYEKVIKIFTKTFYPDAHPESTSVDGYAWHYLLAGLTWGQIITAAGIGSNDSESILYCTYAKSHDYLDGKWEWLYRSILLFDTSALPDGATIIAATLRIYGDSKEDTLSAAPDINVYSSNPASDTVLEAGDFNSLGSTPLCDTPITYAGWNVAGYNDFTLNAAGLAAISKIGITKLGLRNANYDVAGVSPTWVADKRFALWGLSADTPLGSKPKLTITYRV